MQMSWVVFLPILVSLTNAALASQSPQEFADLENWVVASGGKVETYVKTDAKGVRGLYTKAAAKAGDVAATIPSSVFLNTGSIGSSIATSTLIVLRELMDPHTRFAPYIKTWPTRDELLNTCNFPAKYLPLLESEYWKRTVNMTQHYLWLVMTSQVNEDLEFTLQEMVGNAEVTLEDMKYACAVATTRYLTMEARKRLMMVPIFDMKNHHRHCPHTVTPLEGDDLMHLVVGKDVGADEELCYTYDVDMRDDQAVMNYGFLQELEDPPRLLSIDLHGSDSNQFQAPTQPATPEEPFTPKSKDEAEQEHRRLAGILEKLELADKAFNASQWPAPGTDYVFDMLMELRKRRRDALRYELARMQELVDLFKLGGSTT